MKIGPLFIILGLVLVSAPALSEGSEGTAPFLIIDLKDNELRIDAQGISLGQIIDSIESEISIEINGLGSKLDQLITFSGSSASPDMLLRKLLRHLGEKNYAYEYDDDRLIKVTTFPSGSTPSMQAHSPEISHENQMTSVVEVVSIVEDTQAAGLGLETGDVILKYDGVRIFRYDDLIEATTKDIGPTPVKMTALRKGRLINFFLERDFIGVRIRTRRIPTDTLPAGLSAW